MTAGTFDMLHRGHLNLLNTCRTLAGDDGFVHVIVNGDDFVTKFKGVRPVQNMFTRTDVLAALRSVDMAEVGIDKNSLKKRLADLTSFREPVLLVVGSDWAKKNYYKQIGLSKAELDRMNVTLVYVPYTSGVSSTALRERL